MATVSANAAGLVFIFDHAEVDSLISAADHLSNAGILVAPALAAAGIGIPATLVTAAIAAYFKAQAWLIKEVDTGNGVYLTLPWAAIYFGQFWLIVPTTRPPAPGVVGGGRWSDRDTGELISEDNDRIHWSIARSAASPDAVIFRLEIDPATSGWDKLVNMPDGQGSSWDIKARGRGGSAENSLWANQVHNGQVLTFRKPKTVGVWVNVFTLGDLGGLRPGDRATFRWMRD